VSTTDISKASRPEGPYRSRFRDWHTHSAVRAKPLPSLAEDCTPGKLLFTPELVPAATHPLVRERGETTSHRMLAWHLCGHLDFTDTLENEVVTPVTYMIGRRQLGLALPDAMLADARRIAVDEMHHALFATDFIRDIASASGFAPARRRPLFLRRLDEIRAGQPPQLARLILLFFAIVSETLITSTLTRVPADARVARGVRSILRDHAEDEARHHAYFAVVLALAWPQLTPRESAVIGPLLPRFIHLFLTPDLDEVRDGLDQIGLSPREADRVVADAYRADAVNAAVRANAEATLRLMRRTGVLDDARTRDALCAAGLLPT
jgi:hypothetical protein